MAYNTYDLETLRTILEKSLQPRLLDSHPWTKSLFVLQACADAPGLAKLGPGQQLSLAIAKLFIQMMPASPPRRSKRLDTRWGEFGILAAQYFAPLIYGEPVPSSLREAWGHIDQSILFFVYGKPREALSETEKEPYKLVGNELDVAPNSTLNDWRRKGLERLIDVILRRESYLSGTMSEPDVISFIGKPEDPPSRATKPRKASRLRFVFLVLGALLLGLLIFGVIGDWRIYRQAMLVRQEGLELRALITAPGSKFDQVKLAGPALSILIKDFRILKNETKSSLWITPLLSWVPVYGGDLASAQTLINMADSLLTSAEISYQIAAPLLGEINKSGLNPTLLTEELVRAQPQLIEADRYLNLAVMSRSNLPVEKLSPGVRDLILKDVDPLITLLGGGLDIAEDLPRLMGATSEGPKSYLILAQNEDELRPTGGFITAAGTVLMENGRVGDMTFVNSYDLDNWSKPYPAAPWQLQQYMDTSVLVLRDSSWFTNYPTAALYAETMYSYVNSHSVDGVIAFDQQFLVEILDAVGPIKPEGVSYQIDSSNVIAYMRAAKTPTAADLASNLTITKPIFINKIASALLEKIFNGEIPPERLITLLLKTLNERHILLKIDSPSVTAMLTHYRWDGAVRPQAGDFLMVVDTNVGFNKTNAMVQSTIDYDIDLTNPTSPVGLLTVFHENNAPTVICKQYAKMIPPEEAFYPMSDCYWNYLRVYMAKGAELIEATPQYVPANWLIVKKDVAARVDNLVEEINGIQAFGTLQVVPGGESVATSFRFSLPASIVQSEFGRSIYHLLIQKQPGTLAVPFTLRVHLPNNALIKTTTDGAIVQNPNILYQTNLLTDIEFEVVYQVP